MVHAQRLQTAVRHGPAGETEITVDRIDSAWENGRSELAVGRVHQRVGPGLNFGGPGVEVVGPGATCRDHVATDVCGRECQLLH